MKPRIAEIQQSLSKALNAMPGVFSNVQWGGRAYKLPGPGSRGMKKPVLLTHVCMSKTGDAVCLGFRLERSRAKAIVRKHHWIKPHSFRTLSKTGWLETQVRTKTQYKVIVELLRESRRLYAMPEAPTQMRSPRRMPWAQNAMSRAGDQRDPITRRLDSVLSQRRAEGWHPADADAF
jgi:hypothetical protein